MFDRVLNMPLKLVRSFVERRIKTENPLSTFAVEGVISKESMKSFIKLLFKSRQLDPFTPMSYYLCISL